MRVHAEANVGTWTVYDVQLLHVVALSEEYRILLTVYLPADQTRVHNTPVN